MTQGDMIVTDVFDYWTERTGVKLRAKSVVTAAQARIKKRLDEGFTPADLKRCVDFAMADDWYVERGYFRQPDVIWRNGERVASILSRVQRISERPLPL